MSTALSDYAAQLAQPEAYPVLTFLTNKLPMVAQPVTDSTRVELAHMGCMSVFRHWLRRLLGSTDTSNGSDSIGALVKVTQTIPVHGLGRVSYRGTEWSARTIAGKTHKPGDGVTIRRVEGIILIVE
ncbi:NfeD family protein [Fibrella arboris]|uniref:NfeD family protein n=1 Tax=Fibrella arboris TaxID=3242486 RepID=UPI0035203CD7